MLFEIPGRIADRHKRISCSISSLALYLDDLMTVSAEKEFSHRYDVRKCRTIRRALD